MLAYSVRSMAVHVSPSVQTDAVKTVDAASACKIRRIRTVVNDSANVSDSAEYNFDVWAVVFC
jgi:hypothetical protein